MFIKVTKSGNHEYAQLVESFRENGMTRHKVMLNLGRLDHIKNNPSFQRIAKKLEELSTAKLQYSNINDIKDAEIFNYGYLAYRCLWKKYELPGLLNRASGKARFDLDQTCFLMVIQHLLEPRSKLGTHAHQGRYLNLPVIKLHHLYRALDILERSKEKLEEDIFDINRNLFNMAVDVVFFDVTTFHFESVRQDNLKNFGFSKNGKFNEVQVVLGMIIDRTGRPVAYELFPGNTFDGNTLATALEKLEQRFGINRVIIVADRGINSKLNLKHIRDKGYGYVVASRLKVMPEKILESVFDPSGYNDVPTEDATVFRCKSLAYVNRFKVEKQLYELSEKLIVSYSDSRAKKDKADRERFIEKAERLLKNKSQIKASGKRGGKRYLKETADSSVDWVLDEAAILKDTRFDGYYAIQTSEKEITPQEVLDIYHDLWKIEESFRVMKSTLEVRPIFHWTESRIKGHFVLCFLAFLMERALEFRLREAGLSASPKQIREALNSLNFVAVTAHEKKILIKTKAQSLANNIWRLLRLQPLKNVFPEEEIPL